MRLGDTARRAVPVRMHHLLMRILPPVLVALAAGCVSELASSEQALTHEDVDVAPECVGILEHVNRDSLAALDAYLPSDVAVRIITRRDSVPFVSLADLLTVPGVGPARLDQIAAGARRAGRLDATCVGVFDELAVSADDERALLDFANMASELALRAAVPSPAVVPQLLARRPFATLADLAATRGVGPATFRALRNAAIHAATPGPFDTLAVTLNAAQRDVQIQTRFDWTALLTDRDNEPGYLTHATCFGIDPGLLPDGTTVRDQLADGAEVLTRITNHVQYAVQRSGQAIDVAPGLADLAARTQGRAFLGCNLRYTPDPWSGIDRDFYVDTVTGTGVFAELRWSE
jgi:DNA uptake protein ComE-like DNA-binding protein